MDEVPADSGKGVPADSQAPRPPLPHEPLSAPGPGHPGPFQFMPAFPKPQAAPPAPQRSGKSPAAWIFIVVGLAVLCFSVFLNFILLVAVMAQGMSMGMDGGNLVEKRVMGRDAAKIAVVSVQGVISRGESVLLFPSQDMVEHVKSQLRAAAKDPMVKAVVLEVDSPGGTVTASDLIYKEILDFRTKQAKPVVVCMQGMAASGGYYISMAADKIVAHPATLTGSIGVIMQLINYKELSGKYGLKWETFKPQNAPLKDVGSSTRDMTEEDRRVFQTMVEKMYEMFLKRVEEGRKGILTREQIMKLANGQPYLGIEAEELKLVDKLGTLETAIEEAKLLAGIQGDPSVVRYSKVTPFSALFGMKAGQPGPDVSGLEAAAMAIESKLTPRLMYLYCP